MKFSELPLPGAFVVEPELLSDDRGFFARTFCGKEFQERGLESLVSQCSVSFNKFKGTLRGMHYQKEPHAEVKLVRCTMGAAYDVVVDLRESSPTFLKWAGVEISAENRKAVYIPEGFAHGFMTLLDATELFYQISECFHPECAACVSWNDPAFGIKWPSAPTVISVRDMNVPHMKI